MTHSHTIPLGSESRHSPTVVLVVRRLVPSTATIGTDTEQFQPIAEYLKTAPIIRIPPQNVKRRISTSSTRLGGPGVIIPLAGRMNRLAVAGTAMAGLRAKPLTDVPSAAKRLIGVSTPRRAYPASILLILTRV